MFTGSPVQYLAPEGSPVPGFKLSAQLGFSHGNGVFDVFYHHLVDGVATLGYVAEVSPGNKPGQYQAPQ
jgi:hypothetical protein